jgi:hypothetical protein
MLVNWLIITHLFVNTHTMRKKRYRSSNLNSCNYWNYGKNGERWNYLRHLRKGNEWHKTGKKSVFGL